MRPYSGDVPKSGPLHGHRGQVTDEKLANDRGPDDAVVVGDRECAVARVVRHPGEAIEAEHERGGGVGIGPGETRANDRQALQVTGRLTRAWVADVRRHPRAMARVAAVLAIADFAVATSATYERGEVTSPMLSARIENPLRSPPGQQAMGRAVGCEAV
jgi:hypothetical protein